MSEHRAVFAPAARSSFSRRRRWVTGAVGALGAGGLLFGGLARAASPSDLVGNVRLDVWADVHGGWVGDDRSVSGAAGAAYGDGQTPADPGVGPDHGASQFPGGVSMRVAASAEIRSSGGDPTVDVDPTADLNVEHNPDAPGPDPDPTPPLDPDPSPDPMPPLDPDPSPDPGPLPDPITVPDPGPVVPPDPGGVVPPDLDPPVGPDTDPGERCASSRTTPRCGDADDPADTGDPDNVGSTTEVQPASVGAGGGNNRPSAPDEEILGRDGEQTPPAAAGSPAEASSPTPAGATLPKTGGGAPTGALRVLGLVALGRALLSRSGRRRAARLRPYADAARTGCIQ